MEQYQPVTREHLKEQGHSIFEVPPQWRDDPLIQNSLYFTIPRNLLQWLVRQVGENRFDPSALKRERALADAAGEDHSIVGFWNTIPLKYPYLFPRQPLQLDEYARAYLKINNRQSKQLEKLGTNRLSSFDGPLRGFVGWLMTEPPFLEEHDELLGRHWKALQTFGFPQPMLMTPAEGVAASPADSDWVSQFREFYSRWRLQSLAAPGLPVPLAPRAPDVVERCHSGLPEGIQSLSIPDIAPLPGKGMVVESLEDALRGTAPPKHLKGWMDIVRRQNVARNQIPAFERRFRLQHYWRVMRHRHRGALTRKKKVLTGVFAGFLETSDDTIKKDLRFLDRQLGKDWGDRPVEFCATH